MSVPDAKQQIFNASKEFFAIIALLLVAPLALYLDLAVLKNDVGEISVTELTQEGFVLLSMLMFARAAKTTPSSRGFYLLVSGFFACILIRELDQFLDYIWHGFWQIPAAITAATCIGMAMTRYKDSVLEPMAAYTRSREYVFMVGGVLLLLVFSRVFGSGHLLWEHIMGDNYDYVLKSALQEGLELLGYSWMTYGAYRHCICAQRSTSVAESALTTPVHV